MANARGKKWTFTLNNYTETEKSHLEELMATQESLIQYLLFSTETGESGTPHLQGYIELKTRMRLGALKNLLCSRIHLEIARGTAQENLEYCSKEEEPQIFGVPFVPHQGSRTDLESVRAMIQDGSTDLEIANEYFSQWTRYNRSFRLYRQLLNRPTVTSQHPLDSFPEAWRPLSTFDFRTSLILRGLPNIGKTEFAKTILPGALMVSHMDDLSMFDPSFHAGIIFDDMEFTHIPRSAQIHLVDIDNDRSIHIRYQTAFIPKNTKKIFTTNLDDIFLDDSAINRRISKHHLVKV